MKGSQCRPVSFAKPALQLNGTISSGTQLTLCGPLVVLLCVPLSSNGHPIAHRVAQWNQHVGEGTPSVFAGDACSRRVQVVRTLSRVLRPSWCATVSPLAQTEIPDDTPVNSTLKVSRRISRAVQTVVESPDSHAHRVAHVGKPRRETCKGC